MIGRAGRQKVAKGSMPLRKPTGVDQAFLMSLFLDSNFASADFSALVFLCRERRHPWG
jgi:hypothetical protein